MIAADTVLLLRRAGMGMWEVGACWQGLGWCVVDEWEMISVSVWPGILDISKVKSVQWKEKGKREVHVLV